MLLGECRSGSADTAHSSKHYHHASTPRSSGLATSLNGRDPDEDVLSPTVPTHLCSPPPHPPLVAKPPTRRRAAARGQPTFFDATTTPQVGSISAKASRAAQSVLISEPRLYYVPTHQGQTNLPRGACLRDRYQAGHRPAQCGAPTRILADAYQPRYPNSKREVQSCVSIGVQRHFEFVSAASHNTDCCPHLKCATALRPCELALHRLRLPNTELWCPRQQFVRRNPPAQQTLGC